MTKRILALVLALVMCVSVFAGCSGETETKTTEPKTTTEPQSTETQPTEPSEEVYVPQYVENEDGSIVHASYTSVYEKIGKEVTIDMVTEDENGLAYIEYEGTTIELGMDFLSMAMVYNCTVPEGGEYETAEDVFNQWWKLYIQRWNYMAATVPLYSNQYFDLYNAKIENFVTSPYWAAADAIVAATIKEGEENAVILGSSTDLSGAFRNSSWGKSSPGSADLDIQNLTTGHATMLSNIDGAYIWNMVVLAEEPVATMNEDGTLTYTIKINEGLKFSDGTEITAKNYIASALANSTEVAVAAGGTGATGMYFQGYDEFKAYTGPDSEGAQYFEGVKLIDDYTFSITIQADYANYYYASTYAAFSPNPMALYLGEYDIITDENGSCGIEEGFYTKVEKDGAETFAMADVIVANLKWNSELPYSGPYTVSNYDESTLTATLTLNPEYPGDDARGTASIETITYVKMVSETQMDQFKSGQIDVLAGITGATETEEALATVNAEPEKYAETHYDRAGYGKLGFRCDLGPISFTSVRQAIMYTINRPEFAQTFTGGYGTVVHGPYYEGYSAYQAVADEINLNPYTYSVDDAIATLEEGGWIYNEKGEEFVAGTDAVRYKKLEGIERSPQNLAYATVDNAYKTVEIDGEYYMPLAINWYGTQPNDVTDLLVTAWQQNPNATTEIGAYITYTECDFTTGLYGEYLQIEDYGWDGVAKCCAINFATGFTSAIYDYSFYWTIDPDLFPDYSDSYLMDEADFWENYFAE